MKRWKADLLIKRYQLASLFPLALTILSVYFWFNNFRQDSVFLFGLLINVIGLYVWWSGQIILAENWYAGYGKPKIKKLVTYGIYSKIRHPLYWGVNLVLIGLCFVHLNIFLSALSIIMVLYFFWRMHIETKFLINTLGRKYLNYMQKTWI